MRYTKPVVFKTDAMAVIQQQNQHGTTGKIDTGYVDLDFVACSLNAYEADE